MAGVFSCRRAGTSEWLANSCATHPQFGKSMLPDGNSTAPGNNLRVENASAVAHDTVDRLADSATTQVDGLIGLAWPRRTPEPGN
jgi:hypothetical protein